SVHDQLLTNCALAIWAAHAGVGFISSVWPLQSSSWPLQISTFVPGFVSGMQFSRPCTHCDVPVEHTPLQPVLQGSPFTSAGSSTVPLQSSSLPLQVSCTVPASG